MWNLNLTHPVYATAKSQSRVLRSAFIAMLLMVISTNISAGNEGIKIHGDWKITVHNVDGSVAQERSFANALVDTGANIMAGLLSGKMLLNYNLVSQPAWDIVVAKNGVDKATCTYFDEAIDTDPRFSSQLPTGRHAVVEDGPDGQFTLTRTMAIASECITGESYNITGVHTVVAHKPGAGSLDAAGYAWFSSKTLDTAVTGILPDQSVTLKVTYSFE